MSFNTYSFEEVTVTCTHPSVGVETTGSALGSISVAMANDVTAHDVAADGTVMVSKMKRRNGTISMSMQQTSSLHRALIAWYNHIENANAEEWAKMTIVIDNERTGENITCTGVSPQKMTDRGYEAQGGQVTWPLMAAEITHK